METEEKIYFIPGDRVVCSKITKSPEMYVVRKKALTFKDSDNNEKILQGIICRWFTSEGALQEAIFNTKDLKKI